MVSLVHHMKRSPRFVFAGGGTGGHLFPALAIADEIRERLPSASFTFFTSQRRIDDRILQGRDVEVVRQAVSPIGRQPWRWPRVAWQYWDARRLCRGYFSNESPSVVIGTGGYTSVPAVWQAISERIPTAVLNPDARPGKANRLLARMVDVVFAQWSDSTKFLPGKAVVEVSGCAVRREFRNVDRRAALDRFHLDPSRKTLLVTGASQGARTINLAMLELVDLFNSERGACDWQVLHLTGESDAAQVESAYRSTGVRAMVLPFTDHMPEALSISDLVISRAGASTLAEITALGRASILIPYPHHRDQHQVANAECLARSSAANLVLDTKDATSNARSLRPVLQRLLTDDGERLRMADAAARIGRPDAAAKIAERLIQLANL